MPYSKYLIGALLQDSHQLDECLDLCKPKELTDPLAGIVYSSMAQLAAQGVAIDLVTVHERTKVYGVKAEWLANAVDGTVPANAISYANQQHDEYLKKKLDAYAGEVHQLSGRKDIPAKELMAALSKGLDELEGEFKSDKDPSMQAVIERYSKWFEDILNNKIRMLQCHTPGLVNLYFPEKSVVPFWIGGLSLLVSGYSTTGKSAFACNLAMAEAEAGNKIMIFTNEMGEFGYADRAVGYFADIPYGQIKYNRLNNIDVSRIDQAFRRLSELPIQIHEQATKSSEIIRKIKRSQYGFKPDIVIVDYLQNLVGDKGEDSYESLTRQHKELFRAAAKYEFSLVTLSQVSNQSGKEQIGTQDFMDVKGSGDVAADASIFIGLKRKTMDKLADKQLTMLVKKNRDFGNVGVKHLLFNDSFTKLSVDET